MFQPPNRENDGDETVATEVIRTVAAYANVEPAELPPIHDVVDPDALDAIFVSPNSGPARSTGRVVFEFAGFEVTVSADGSVDVKPLDSV